MQGACGQAPGEQAALRRPPANSSKDYHLRRQRAANRDGRAPVRKRRPLPQTCAAKRHHAVGASKHYSQKSCHSAAHVGREFPSCQLFSERGRHGLAASSAVIAPQLALARQRSVDDVHDLAIARLYQHDPVIGIEVPVSGEPRTPGLRNAAEFHLGRNPASDRYALFHTHGRDALTLHIFPDDRALFWFDFDADRLRFRAAHRQQNCGYADQCYSLYLVLRNSPSV